MYYFIEKIMTGNVMMNWLRKISDKLDTQLRNLRKTKQFYMSSYMIYLLARKYTGLVSKCMIGNYKDQFKEYDCYPELQLHERASYRRVNDITIIIHKLQ